MSKKREYVYVKDFFGGDKPSVLTVHSTLDSALGTKFDVRVERTDRASETYVLYPPGQPPVAHVWVSVLL